MDILNTDKHPIQEAVDVYARNAFSVLKEGYEKYGDRARILRTEEHEYNTVTGFRCTKVTLEIVDKDDGRLIKGGGVDD
ncbi:hypothetical protein [Weissella ceti]|uniref:Uncharacterized protein n=1 Tax=Weissella ceti TaxID=759620 RepID=A0A088GGI2_9LACO|nr:hypothetical protein [Weissella ceti]AIM63086.1 hypothetical protein WS74_0834 [Weissella ceti]